jgi:hypothetical protein
MTTINANNNSLISESGGGNFSGSDNLVSTGDCNLSGASSLEIPNVALTPVLVKTGQIAIDTLVPGYPGVFKYYDGSQVMSLIPISAAQIAAFADGQAITYVSANSRIEGVNLPVGTSGKTVQVIRSEVTSDDITTSTTVSDTSLSASIVPINSANTLKITFSGYATELDLAAVANLKGHYVIRRTTGVAADISSTQFGATLPSPDFSVSSKAHCPIKIVQYETAGDILTHTYVVRFLSDFSGNRNTLNNSIFTGSLSIEEITA